MKNPQENWLIFNDTHEAIIDRGTWELAQKLTKTPRRVDFSELTTPMINEFIDKILVHAPYYIDGERMQEVEIYLNFIGKFEIPQPQLSEEEIKRQKQLKQPV